jgi:hypothetical protein
MGQVLAKIFNGKWRMLALGMALVGFGASVALPAPSALAAAYSCGSYSSGSYSSSSTCTDDTSGGGTDTGGTTDGVGAPNTGFARLMEPTNLAAIIGSLTLIVAGIIIMIRSRNRKKQNASFHS